MFKLKQKIFFALLIFCFCSLSVATVYAQNYQFGSNYAFGSNYNIPSTPLPSPTSAPTSTPTAGGGGSTSSTPTPTNKPATTATTTPIIPKVITDNGYWIITTLIVIIFIAIAIGLYSNKQRRH